MDLYNDTKKYKLLIEFKNQMIKFLDELIEQFSDRGEFMILRIFVKDQIPLEQVLGKFITDVLPYQDIINKRNPAIFLETDIISGALLGASQEVYLEENKETANALKSLWLSGRLDDADRDTIWDWLELFLAISERYYKSFGCVPGWESNIEERKREVNKYLK